jgi:hypothetical protein
MASSAPVRDLRRRADEARAFVARIDPSLLDTSQIDTTLHDLTLSRSVMERFEDAYRHELGNQWLRGLRLASPSGSR